MGVKFGCLISSAVVALEGSTPSGEQLWLLLVEWVGEGGLEVEVGEGGDEVGGGEVGGFLFWLAEIVRVNGLGGGVVMVAIALDSEGKVYSGMVSISIASTAALVCAVVSNGFFLFGLVALVLGKEEKD